MEERMIKNIEKLIVLAIKNEGAAYFKSTYLFIGAIKIMNGPDSTVSKKRAERFISDYDEPIIMLSKDIDGIYTNLRDNYELIDTCDENSYMPLRCFAKLVIDKNLEYAE